jgi:hypothetical protein
MGWASDILSAFAEIGCDIDGGRESHLGMGWAPDVSKRGMRSKTNG